ncbi:hypothetical protein PHLCEN_2v11002 [Hermanssonia centrifuga]|uniref:Uncharacterized protein n=1 Tax=Hermanssonia centrifuga TaxID=98765 RepID=A0A2R6NLE2_9APHY|nr:hypothetical protein PHLCEN_2v11002 [Hermanssonia centrifuga]
MYGCLDQCRQVSKKKRGLKSILYSQAEAHKAEMEKLNNEASRGLHSPNGAARVKPAILELMRKRNLLTKVDPRNDGIVIVSLNGSKIKVK